MGNTETHDFAPVRPDERRELNLSRKVNHKHYSRVKYLDVLLILFRSIALLLRPVMFRFVGLLIYIDSC